jgi:hypothetical protein
MVQGAFTSDGNLKTVSTVGFRPRKVELINEGGLVTGEWVEGMADDSVSKRITSGTMTVPTSGGVIPLSNGFSLGADADLNASGELVRWSAHE